MDNLKKMYLVFSTVSNIRYIFFPTGYEYKNVTGYLDKYATGYLDIYATGYLDKYATGYLDKCATGYLTEYPDIRAIPPSNSDRRRSFCEIFCQLLTFPEMDFPFYYASSFFDFTVCDNFYAFHFVLWTVCQDMEQGSKKS